MAKAIFIGVILIIGAAGVFSGKSKPEEKPSAVPHGAKSGDLTALEPCKYQPGKQKFDAECGTLTVPENWEDPDSRLIGLPIVRIPTVGANPTEPIFILLGGPGASNLLFSPKAWLLENHDVVIVGYRGVDGTVELGCSEVSEISAKFLGKRFLSDEANAELVAAAGQCAERFQAEGIDLRGYTAQGVVKDLEAARQALGYGRINLWSESYGTRVAQLFAYLYPDSLHRTMMIGMNTPGHFVYDPAVLDEMINHISELCEKDEACNGRSQTLAQAMYDVNHNMPRRWLFFPIDPGTIRMLTHMMFFNTANMPMVIDAYLAAADGDPSGLAMLNFIGPFVFPFDMFRMGDFLSKGGTLDLDYYQGPQSMTLGNSVMGAPLAEWVWPMAAEWPVEPVTADLRRLQESNVDMLVVNGTVDFSTPPTALDELKPYYHNAQTVLLPEFSHTGDVRNLQPEAFQRLVTSYYDTGLADDSLFEYQPLRFKPGMSMALAAKLLLAGMIILPLLLITALVVIVRRVRH
ncbi:MAG: alpha/beta fold hydrolase [Anaerolineales bacterium]|nr:alpha/beta fold hydrolase [Anaerolineales bacterium]